MNYLKTTITITAEKNSFSKYIGSKTFADHLSKLDLNKRHINRPKEDTLILILEERTTPGRFHNLVVDHQLRQAEKLSFEAGAHLILYMNTNNENIETTYFNQGVRLDSLVAA